MGLHDRDHLPIEAAQQFDDWLAQNHASSPGVWLVTFKKGSGKPAPSYDEMVRVALRWGWVDSIPGKVDELQTKLYFSPRKPGSAWSKSNKQRVDELLSAGLIQPPGLTKIAEAKASGAWSKIDEAQDAVVPADLLASFEAHPGSQENFDAFPRGVRKQILEWITLAKTPATREKRILETASLAAQNIRANQWRDKSRPSD